MRPGIRDQRAVRALGLLLGACLLAGVVLAGVLSPAVIGAGLLSNQVNGSINEAAAGVSSD
jgi:hypothetical protein